MALDKAIEHGKERRKPYKGSKVIDYTCRNHGACEWCRENRQHKFIDKKLRTPKELKELLNEAYYGGGVHDHLH